MYHASRKECRESILVNGLDYRRSPWGTCHEMPGNYLFDKFEDGLDYYGGQGYGEYADPAWDLWEMIIDNRNLLTNNWKNEEPGYIMQSPIPKEKIRLLFTSDDCFACKECPLSVRQGKTECPVLDERLADKSLHAA